MNREMYLSEIENILIENKVSNKYGILHDLELKYHKLEAEGMSNIDIINNIGSIESFKIKYQTNEKVEKNYVEGQVVHEEASKREDSYQKESFKDNQFIDSDFTKRINFNKVLKVIIIIAIINIIISSFSGYFFWGGRGFFYGFSYLFRTFRIILFIVAAIIVIKIINNKE